MSNQQLNTQPIPIHKRLRKWAEIGWIVVVFGTVTYYIVQNFDNLTEQLGQMQLINVVLSCLALIVARILLPLLSVQAVTLVDHKPDYKRMFYVTSVSQLAKYLPGSIWQFVGKAAFFRADGLMLRATVQALILENIWLLSAAGFMSAILLLASQAHGVELLAIPFIVILWGLVIFLTAHRYENINLSQFTLGAWLSQTGLWLAFGASFALLMLSHLSVSEIPLVMGSFCMSFVIGFLVIFAPGGIGIREAVLTTFLLPILPAEQILIFAGVHRFLWILIEVLMGIIARGIANQTVTEQVVQST